MGGRAAEEVIYGKDYVTTGASNDFQHATKIAHLMVTKLGMQFALQSSSGFKCRHELSRPPVLEGFESWESNDLHGNESED
jgi:hypothetical protein